MQKFLLFGICILILLPSINALVLNDSTVLNTTVSHSSMTFSVPIYLNKSTIETNYINLRNITNYDNGIFSYTGKYDLNWTSSNSNLDSFDFIELVSNTSTMKYIKQYFFGNITASATFGVSNCDSIDNIRYTTYSGVITYLTYSCSSNVVTLSNLNIETGGNNVIEIFSNSIDTPSRNILRNVLGVFVALVMISVTFAPLLKIKDLDWTVGQWMVYFIVVIISITLVIILLEQIFSVTFTG